MKTDKRVTDLLLALQGGDREAFDDLVPVVYDALRAIARRRLRSERAGHSLATTDLVHEAYLKLVQIHGMHWQSRAHFFAVAAQAMRRILVNHALRRKRTKRGGGALHVRLEDVRDLPLVEADRILELDAALMRLAEENPRHVRIIECRFFSGMSIEETAAALGVSPSTAKRDWAFLRAWLRHELDAEP